MMKNEFNHSLFAQNDEALFAEYGTFFSPLLMKKNATVPFKDHPQFQTIIDIICRKHSHHALLFNHFSSLLRESFINAFFFHLQQECIPLTLQATNLVYFDIDKALRISPQKVEQDFLLLMNKLENSDKYFLIALSDARLFEQTFGAHFFQQLNKFFHLPQCRFLVFTDNKLNSTKFEFFTEIALEEPHDQDILAILKLQRIDLENYHQVIIPEEILSSAYALSERYLSSKEALQKTLLLLDSSAARAKQIEWENGNQFKPAVSLNILYDVLSTSTQIPASHLQMQKIKLNELTIGLQQRIFGQDTAIHLLTQHLMQAQTHLHYQGGPYAALHFTGPHHVGKRSLAFALTDQLFKQLRVLHISEKIQAHHQSLFALKFERGNDHYISSLKDILKDCPYAILMLECHDSMSLALQEELYTILHTGNLSLNNELQCLRQTMIILSTHIGSKILQQYVTALSPEEDEADLDLMQLIAGNKKPITQQSYFNVSTDIIDEIQKEAQLSLPIIAELLPIIPFLPLSKFALEKIIRLKLKLLGKLLDTRYGIELGYAPEVISYLANEVLLRQRLTNKALDIEKTLKQLYFIVEQAILSQSENKNRPNQLFLQLNETGQLLRCDWLMLSTSRQHTQ